MAPASRLLHEKHGLLAGHTTAIEGGQHWRKTVIESHSRILIGQLHLQFALLLANCMLSAVSVLEIFAAELWWLEPSSGTGF